MGFMDKLKKTAEDAQTAASQAVDNKLAQREQAQIAKAEQKELQAQRAAEEKQEQEALKAVFRATNDMGDVTVDSENRLLKIRRCTDQVKKESGALMKTGKAIAAVYTLGASVAVEAAVKHATRPDDKIFRWESVRSFELMEDDSQVVGGGVGMALVGGAFFGGAGAVAGSIVGGKKTKKTCDSLVLKINLNDFDHPCVIVTYISKTTKKTSNDYKKAFSAAQQTVSCLEMIVEQVGKEEAANAPAPEPTKMVVEHVNATPSVDDPVEKVKKLKELLDMGVLTQEEFDAKKKELLGL